MSPAGQSMWAEADFISHVGRSFLGPLWRTCCWRCLHVSAFHYRLLATRSRVVFVRRLFAKFFICPPFTHRLRKLLRISYLEHKTNDWVRGKINFLMGPQEPLLATVERGKLAAWFGHVTSQDSLSKTILQGTLERGRRRGPHPGPCQNCSQGPPAEKTARGSLLPTCLLANLSTVRLCQARCLLANLSTARFLLMAC